MFLFNLECTQSVKCTDIHQRSQTSYTAPCNGVVSHGAQFGGLRVFCRNKCKSNAFLIYAFVFMFVLMLWTQYIQVTYILDEPWLIWSGEKPKDPQFKPHAKIKMAQVLRSLVYICGIILTWCIMVKPRICINHQMNHQDQTRKKKIVSKIELFPPSFNTGWWYLQVQRWIPNVCVLHVVDDSIDCLVLCRKCLLHPSQTRLHLWYGAVVSQLFTSAVPCIWWHQQVSDGFLMFGECPPSSQRGGGWNDSIDCMVLCCKCRLHPCQTGLHLWYGAVISQLFTSAVPCIWWHQQEKEKKNGAFVATFAHTLDKRGNFSWES